ncbi:MAG TPA: glycerol-3-phosphate 1-O-acyltransferase PlsY [Stellaceae bacterium]|nr:glycerol-3-phosphate 1-O-acyltransferase PlsY [Stellaceae bacterium]
MGDFTYTWPFLAGAVVAYLLGSIPFGLLLTKLGGYGDIRHIGSGNIGATNVLRTGNKGLAALTVLLDAGKGALAVALAEQLGPDMAAIAAVFAFLGHLFPIWLGFKGGKGVATSGGILLAYAWPVGLAAMATWLALAVLTRYSSLAALIAAVLSPLYAWFLIRDPQTTEVVALLAVLVVLRHHANIRRLLKGEESKIRLGKS